MMKRLLRIIFLLLIVAAALFSAPVLNGYFKYRDTVKETPLSDRIAELKAQEHYTVFSEVPEIYVNAVIAAEDRRFFLHNGFDFIGTARAILRDIKEKELVEGGSTITQQLAKNLYFPLDNTLERKIAEIFLSFDLEKNYSKEDILEFYFNGIYYGSGYYNIYDASQGYFSKKPSELNSYEATLLAGVPNAPSVYSPKVNPDLAHKRQEKVVACLVDCGYIDQDEAQAILTD
ncbi:MAG: glycosyl transferase [Ruminococcaceae bacterium]|nr:glycosyl transferase [Oscillospiraceae bacterium]